MLFPLAITTAQGVFDILDAVYARDYLRPNDLYLVLMLRRRANGSPVSPADRCFFRSIPGHITDVSRALFGMGVSTDGIVAIANHAQRRANEVVQAPEFIAAGSEL